MKVSGANQLWIADITYIRLKAEFVYLAVVFPALDQDGSALWDSSSKFQRVLWNIFGTASVVSKN
jgi:hypothetical protein